MNFLFHSVIQETFVLDLSNISLWWFYYKQAVVVGPKFSTIYFPVI